MKYDVLTRVGIEEKSGATVRKQEQVVRRISLAGNYRIGGDSARLRGEQDPSAIRWSESIKELRPPICWYDCYP